MKDGTATYIDVYTEDENGDKFHVYVEQADDESISQSHVQVDGYKHLLHTLSIVASPDMNTSQTLVSRTKLPVNKWTDDVIPCICAHMELYKLIPTL